MANDHSSDPETEAKLYRVDLEGAGFQLAKDGEALDEIVKAALDHGLKAHQIHVSIVES